MTTTTLYDSFFHYFGLRENPFHVSPNPRFYYPTPQHDSALAELTFGIETRQGFLILTGEAGTGKTTLLKHLLDWLHHSHKSSSYVFHSQLDPAELFECILRDFGISCSSLRKADILDALHQWLLARYSAGDSPVIIIDEAQNLSPRTLDELRLLLNLELPSGKLVQIVLAGQPELQEKLAHRDLRQLHQRIMIRCSLAPLSLAETTGYIRSRLAGAGVSDESIFPEGSVSAIHAYSGGIPRVINLLCEHALIGAFADQLRFVSVENIHRVAVDFDLTTAYSPTADPTSCEARSRLIPFPAFDGPFSNFAVNQHGGPQTAASPAGQMLKAILEEFVASGPPSLSTSPNPATKNETHPIAPETPQRRGKDWHIVTRHSPAYHLVRRAPAAFSSYWTSVHRSFVHDWRTWLHSVAPGELAARRSSLKAHTTSSPTLRQSVFIPIRRWFRRPFFVSTASSSSPSKAPTVPRGARS